MRSPRRTFLSVLLSLLASCGGSPPATDEPPTQPGGSPLVFMERPVKFCRRPPAKPWSGGAQILLDSSGSMVGVKQAVPSIVNWLQHGLSQIRTSTLDITNSRLCGFSETFIGSQGFGNCTELGRSAQGFAPSGNTNLHTAIASAKDYGLSIILTDGVGATGGRGAGDCAGGVDAACVARSLRAVVSTPGSQPEGVNWGVWVMPLAVPHDGIFYTEESISPSTLDLAATQERVREETGAQPTIGKPFTGVDGRLNFATYRGPRMLLLIVIARWADLGRTAVATLWDRMEGVGIKRAERMQDLASLSGGVSSFLPVELYPGFSDRLEWRELTESQESDEASGTMDVYFVRDSQSVEMTCPQGETAAGTYELSGASPDADRVAGCVDILVAPPFTFTFRPAREGEELSQFVRDVGQEEASRGALRLRLSCDMSSPRPCQSDRMLTRLVGVTHYDKAADALAAPEATYAVTRQLKGLSTAHPSGEPHRIFGLADTLKIFYSELGTQPQSFPVAELKFCHR